ncbi:hypothetical protein [Bacillus sp. LL01]|nr:hypothetical protein [Bacillus sp. LL01]
MSKIVYPNEGKLYGEMGYVSNEEALLTQQIVRKSIEHPIIL